MTNIFLSFSNENLILPTFILTKKNLIKKILPIFHKQKKKLIEINLAMVKVDSKNLMTLFLFLTVILNNQRDEDNSDFYGNEIASVAII